MITFKYFYGLTKLKLEADKNKIRIRFRCKKFLTEFNFQQCF